MLMQRKLWFTASELADLQLSGLPKDKRGINRLAKDERWAIAVDAHGSPLARRHSGQGGGLEYHVELLPASARADLARLGMNSGEAAVEVAENSQSSQLWDWLANQPETVRSEAQRRAAILSRVDLLTDARTSVSQAVAAIAAEEGVSPQTIWNWRKLVKLSLIHI